MTIPELIARVVPSGSHYDPQFAKKFRSLTRTVCEFRKRVNAAPAGDHETAKKYFDSWRQYQELFADDPKSLAALTIPRVRIKGKLCPTEVGELFPESLTGTPTVQLALYSLELAAKEPKDKPTPATSRYKTGTKKVNASKKK